MVFTENLDLFFKDFGQTVQIGPSGSAVEVTAIFDNKHYAVTDGVGQWNTTEPTLTVKTSDVAAYSKGARVIVGGVEYYADSLEPDGTGVTKIKLKRA